jgi:hypothetical protein
MFWLRGTFFKTIGNVRQRTLKDTKPTWLQVTFDDTFLSKKQQETVYTISLFFSVSNSTELSPSWEANSHSATQKFPQILWNPEIHYGVQNTPQRVPFLNQMNPVHTIQLQFRKIYFNIILPSTCRSP